MGLMTHLPALWTKQSSLSLCFWYSRCWR